MEKYSFGKGYVYIDPDNYIYSLKNYRGNRFYLYCHEKGCNGSSAIINDRIKHIRPHSHHANKQEAEMIKFKAVLKYRSQTELNKNVKEIFHEEKKIFQEEEVDLSVADFNKFKANMYRDRRRVAPHMARKARLSQTKKSKTKSKSPNKFQKNDLKIELKDENNINYNQQSVNTDENLTIFTDDIDNFSNEEVLILSNDTEMITENDEIIIPENCCLDESQEDCEHKVEIKTLRKKMISILKDHSYTNVNTTTKNEDSNLKKEETTAEIIQETTDINDHSEYETTNLEVLSDNDLSEFIVEPQSPSSTEEDSNPPPESNSPRKYAMDVEDQIVTNEIKLEILNSEDLRTEVDKLRKEVIILKKLLIEKERIIDSQEKYILLLENRR